MRWTLPLLGFLLLTFVPARAGHSPPQVVFRVNVQTTGAGLSAQQASTISLPPNGEQIQVRTMPELTELNIVGVQQDAGGVHFQFDHSGTVNLDAVTGQNQGRILVVLVDNVIFYAPVIDMQISNGRLDIPRQLPAQVVGLLQEVAQRNLRQNAKT